MFSYSAEDVRESLGLFREGIRLEPEKATLLEASFDESGKLNDSEIVCFGGCVGTHEKTSAFAAQWEAVLKKHGLLYGTSMKDAMHFHGGYENWRDNSKARDNVVLELAEALSGSALLMISTPIRTADFKSLTQAERERFWNDPQYCGFEACIMSILDMGKTTVLHAVCDLSEQYAVKCITLFNKLRARNQIVKARCFGITFADDSRHSCLQAADMIAYCSRANAMRDVRPVDPLVEQVIGILGKHGGSTEFYEWKAGHGLASGKSSIAMPE